MLRTDERCGFGTTIASCGSSLEAMSLTQATSITASMETLCSTLASTSSTRRTATVSDGSRGKPAGVFVIARIYRVRVTTIGAYLTIGGRCIKKHKNDQGGRIVEFSRPFWFWLYYFRPFFLDLKSLSISAFQSESMVAPHLTLAMAEPTTS